MIELWLGVKKEGVVMTADVIGKTVHVGLLVVEGAVEDGEEVEGMTTMIGTVEVVVSMAEIATDQEDGTRMITAVAVVVVGVDGVEVVTMIGLTLVGADTDLGPVQVANLAAMVNCQVEAVIASHQPLRR